MGVWQLQHLRVSSPWRHQEPRANRRAAPLFALAVPGGAMGWQPSHYDVSADGRFLAAIVEPHVPERPSITVALSATAGLKPSPAR